MSAYAPVISGGPQDPEKGSTLKRSATRLSSPLWEEMEVGV